MTLANLDRRPTIEQVRQRVAYDEKRGWLFWLVTQGVRAVAGTPVERKGKTSIDHIMIDGCSMRISHLIYAVRTGRWPRVQGRIDTVPPAEIEQVAIPEPPPMPTGEPTYEDFAKVLSYDPETGEIRWKMSLNHRGRVGDLAGYVCEDGYIRVSLWKRSYPASHIAFFLMTGSWPSEDIDHRDLNRSNNAWSNLRPASRAQNIANVRARSTNASGFKGVAKVYNRWHAAIMVNGVKRRIGSYDTPEEAHEAYKVEAKKAWGEFARFD